VGVRRRGGERRPQVVGGGRGDHRAGREQVEEGEGEGEGEEAGAGEVEGQRVGNGRDGHKVEEDGDKGRVCDVGGGVEPGADRAKESQVRKWGKGRGGERRQLQDTVRNGVNSLGRSGSHRDWQQAGHPVSRRGAKPAPQAPRRLLRAGSAAPRVTPSDRHTALERAVDTPRLEDPATQDTHKSGPRDAPRSARHTPPRTVARPLSLGLPVEFGHPPHPRRRPHQVHHLPQRKVRVHRRVAPQPPHILGEAGGAGAAEAEARQGGRPRRDYTKGGGGEGGGRAGASGGGRGAQGDGDSV